MTSYSPTASVKFNPDDLPYINPRYDRRVCLITGANSGIGWFTALHLYLHGYIVYIGGRNKLKVERAISDITKEAKRRKQEKSYIYLGKLIFLEIDLLDLDSVEKSAEEFKKREPKLHILINNAGIMALPFSYSKDNFEIQVQTNYISPFLLTQRLIPLMSTVEKSRILYVSSIGHNLYFKRFSMDSTFDYHPNIIFTWLRYGLSKTSGIHYIKNLSLKYPNILCLAVNPGFVMSTNLLSHWTRLPIVGLFFWIFFQIFGFFFGVDIETGCYSTIKCCLDENLTSEKDNGKYFSTYGIEAEPSSIASNMDYAAETWVWTTTELNKRGHPIE
ncbi:hypothetical protein PACTADRAFT_47653 [Pachysolen tannophilus NRRL Y-2460]|uniref:NAD(P)-binding protein n=1 Tax=Pachysolen tannophilus NRRL Y-2460 TaxID=669874 RepID=A0A1E4U1C5_PACTA|nr:hypothetical protein PACTADRAFT_47653 [Pachysolen tannophilus NRRL Y-2460]